MNNFKIELKYQMEFMFWCNEKEFYTVGNIPKSIIKYQNSRKRKNRYP